MFRPLTRLAVPALALSTLLLLTAARGQNNKPASSPYYEEDVPASNPLRTEQARELDAYVEKLRNDPSRLHALLKPDYSSPRAFEKSVRPYREAYCKTIGYPPPGEPDREAPSFTRLGEDGIGTYYRAKISVLPGVHAEGLYIVPKGLKGKAPLLISMHGGGGSPEVATFHGGANYHDMVRGGVKQGYVVWAPQHLFSAQGYPGNIRNQVDDRMLLVGTSITAVEIAKITRSLDVILKRPEVDPKRVGMVGLSYGGFYALVTPAVDTRIKVAVSSCYYGAQEWRYQKSELGLPSDFRSQDRMTLFKDADLVAMIAPRALLIQAGARDDDDHREGGVQQAPASAEYYQKLGQGERFRFYIFPGSHEFDDASAWPWLKKYL